MEDTAPNMVRLSDHINVFGIDPGVIGAVARIRYKVTEDGEADFVDIVTEPMPVRVTIKSRKRKNKTVKVKTKQVDGTALVKLLERMGLYESPSIALVENVWARPGEGVTSSFSFGCGFGIVIGVLEANNVPIEFIVPTVWKRIVFGAPTADKAVSVAYCAKTYPALNLLATTRSKTAHDGMADAACIASVWYTMRHATQTQKTETTSKTKRVQRKKADKQ